MRIAVTGSTGRLGGALIEHLREKTGWDTSPWGRVEFDLDAPATIDAAIGRDRPDVVIHCAAWTDVDACAREPQLANRRNGFAVGILATACARRGVGLATVSTNEVFDGLRTDRRPYRTSDSAKPGNPYGASKRLGEELAMAAFEAAGAGRLWIVRTAWLFGPSGTDFPAKIIAAARTAIEAGRTLSLVADEFGNPTFAPDLAAGIVDLIGHDASIGLNHVVNEGMASRAEWARRVLEGAELTVPTQDVSIESWARPSTPPRWGVLEPTALPTLGHLRPWSEALMEDLDRRRAVEGQIRAIR